MTAIGDANAVEVRRADVDDIEALVGLRRHLLSNGAGHYAARSATEDQQWQSAYRLWLDKHLRGGARRMCVAVASDPAGSIVACAIGIIDERAPMVGCLNGSMGWVQSVVVAPDWRRKGVGARTMKFLLEWFEQNEIGKIALQTTPAARGLYQQLAFHSSGEDLLIRLSH
jgi:GNAT superfamily N-acetyltransferase